MRRKAFTQRALVASRKDPSGTLRAASYQFLVTRDNGAPAAHQNKLLTTNYKLRTGTSGFSLVEMLVAAAILAIGILGLAMLQAMSLRAARGSNNMVVAARVAERIMDEVEKEGRLTWLNMTDSNRAPVPGARFVGMNLDTIPYLDKLRGSDSTLADKKFNAYGGEVIPGSTDPRESIEFFTVSVSRREDNATGSVGIVSDFNIRVTFSDAVDSSGAAIPRTFNLTRRIIHG